MQANIGIIDANPSSTSGVIDILSHLHQYVPQKGGEVLRAVAAHGDCGAVERMIDARRARSCEETSVNRLEGLEPVPQEFHHRGVMLQVSFCLVSPPSLPSLLDSFCCLESTLWFDWN